MNRILTLAMIGAVALSVRGATVTIDKVQQRYPWNGIVDIDYTVALADGEPELTPTKDSLRFFFINEGVTPVTTNAVYVLEQGAAPVSSGRHRISWNAHADGVTCVSDQTTLRVELAHQAPRYLVIDISNTNGVGKYEVAYLEGEPQGGFNQPLYKDSKIAFRLIPPGSYLAGAHPGEYKTTPPTHPVTLTHPFYMAIFEVTQKQYERVLSLDPTTATKAKPVTDAAFQGDYRPVSGVVWNTWNGSKGFVALLRARTDLDLERPWEFQWEYACRAGTTTLLYSGVACKTEAEFKAELKKLGRCQENLKEGDYDGNTTTVGSYLPNAWGLYDMLGNVGEYCRDYYQDKVEDLHQYVDPTGPSSGTGVLRGGEYKNGVVYCQASYRNAYSYGVGQPYMGLRLSVQLP